MNYDNFLLFNLFQKIDYIQHFRENILFVANNQKIFIYDCCKAQSIYKESHLKLLKPHQNHNNNQLNKNQQVWQVLSMKFLKINQQNQIIKQKEKTMGHLIIQYKLKGFAIYKIIDQNQNNSYKLQNKYIFQNCQPKYKLLLEYFQNLKFSSGFLKLCYPQTIYLRQKIINQPQIIKQQSTQQKIKEKLRNIIFESQYFIQKNNFNKNSVNYFNKYFFALIDSDQFLQIIKYDIIQRKILQKYQLDDQNQTLNNSIITLLKYYQYQNYFNQKQQFLIMAAEAGLILLYKIPILENNQKFRNKISQKEYYLEAYKKYYLSQYFIKNKSKESNQFNQLQITNIQFLEDMLAILTIRKQGLFLFDLKSFQIIRKIQLSPQKTLSDIINLQKINSSFQIKKKEQKCKEVNQSQKIINKFVLFKNQFLISNQQNIYFFTLNLKEQKHKLRFSQISAKIGNQRKIKIMPSSFMVLQQNINTKNIKQMILINQNQINYRNQANWQQQKQILKKQQISQAYQSYQVYGFQNSGKIFYFQI